MNNIAESGSPVRTTNTAAQRAVAMRGSPEPCRAVPPPDRTAPLPEPVGIEHIRPMRQYSAKIGSAVTVAATSYD